MTSTVNMQNLNGNVGHQSNPTTITSGTLMASTSAPIAPIIEPPKEFGHVAPGIYRCSASSLVKGLSPAPKRWHSTLPPKLVQLDSNKTITTIHSSSAPMVNNPSGSSIPEGEQQNEVSSLSPWSSNTNQIGNSSHNNSGNGSTYPAGKNSNSSTTPILTPTESFLSSLQLRMILLIAPEKMPTALRAWCALNNVKLIHLGLGALADSVRIKLNQDLNRSNNVMDEFSSNLFMGSSNIYAHSSSADMMSLERITKESLELILNKNNLPCLICDMSGVNETGIVIGCLRRLQRFNFASIRLEYRSFAGNRARSSHERFIEMFDTDMIDLPNQEQLPFWLLDQFTEDEKEEDG